jgi:hypothetical protein
VIRVLPEEPTISSSSSSRELTFSGTSPLFEFENRFRIPKRTRNYPVLRFSNHLI